jgi:GT2 family glycosyltransferase
MPSPELSLLICAHNRLDLTRECLRTLFTTLPPALNAEVLFYDDCSTDGTADSVEQLSSVHLFRGSQRGSFAANVNRLSQVARGRWLCLLNNDTLLHPGWLEALLDLAEREPRAAVLGNFHRYPQTGRVNHAGVVFADDLSFHHLYQGMPAELAAARVSRPFQCVSAACMLTRADVFRQLGGFDEGFRNGCEDLDYCLKVRELGPEVWYSGASRIDHYGQSTPGRMADDAANLRRFRERWASRLRADLGEVTASDGVCWPSRSSRYRLVYSLWKTPAAAPLRNLVMRLPVGVRLRQRVLGILHA